MEALAHVGIEQHASTPASLLPVSAKKRLMIATALATDPACSCSTSRSAASARTTSTTPSALIKRIRDAGMAIVCIEHVMRALVALADRVLVMHHGAELFLGTPEAMLADKRVVDVYLGARGGGAA